MHTIVGPDVVGSSALFNTSQHNGVSSLFPTSIEVGQAKLWKDPISQASGRSGENGPDSSLAIDRAHCERFQRFDYNLANVHLFYPLQSSCRWGRRYRTL